MFDEWTVELKAMINRIIHLRQQLLDALRDIGKATRFNVFVLYEFIDFNLFMQPNLAITEV